uniref:Uncharacterized protein n=1 Tax=Triticum urartu TaxID=4572 RepID=A0A8R7PPJ4_TRIUA
VLDLLCLRRWGSFVPGPLVGNGGVLSEPAVPQQHGAAASREAQIWSAKEDAAARRGSSPTTSKLSTGKMNPRLPDGIRGSQAIMKGHRRHRSNRLSRLALKYPNGHEGRQYTGHHTRT